MLYRLFMKRPVFPLLLLFGLLCLLALLATLQYRWLGEISQSERERMEKRLQSDSQKFADDFNGEIRKAYFAFQLDSDIWINKDWAEFNKSYQIWRSQTAYQDLIGEFYFLEKDKNPLKFDAEKKQFVPAQTNAELNEISARFNRQSAGSSIIEPLIIDDYTIVMANYGGGEMTGRDENGIPHIEPQIVGFLVFKLDETAVKRLLSDLTKRYFPPDDTFNYNLSIIRQSDSGEILKSAENFTASTETNDFSIPIYDLSIGNFNLITRNSIFTTSKSKAKIFIAERKSDKLPFPLPSVSDKNNLKVQIFDNQVQEKKREANGIWLLNIRHSAGSLNEFISTTRRKNLAISFGILSLLAVSVVLIFLSAQRAKRFAQKQVDFVSAVSHEFRTPLAVIRSAGENLIDGVVKNENQVSQYGTLIKREGVKLSAMVEQILEFAGASSGKQKYDLRETRIEIIVENAMAECEPLIKEKEFTVEKEIAENLPPVTVDEKVLSQAIQNLIVNSVKYSNGSRWLKISAKSGGGKIKIAVEDKGIGIAPKDLKHVFEPFYRSKTVVDEQIHGNGLGLSLVRQSVEAHGGKVEVKSEIGKGSEFTIILTT